MTMAKPDWGELQQRFLSEHAKSGISPKDWCEEQGLNYTSARRYIKKPAAQKTAQKEVRNAQTEQAPTTAQHEQTPIDAQADTQESAQPFNLRNYGLNDMQVRFVEEYLIDLNRTAAYRRAGYKGGGQHGLR
jgi:phage terminase small subunit